MKPTKMYALVNRRGTLVGDPSRSVFTNWLESEQTKEGRIVRVLVTEVVDTKKKRKSAPRAETKG